MKRQGRQLSPAGGGGSRRAAVDPCGQREDESIPASATPMLPHHETFPRGFPTRAVVEAVASRWEVVVDSSAAGVDESMTEAGGERTSRRPTQRGGVGTGGAVVWSLCGRRMRMSGGKGAVCGDACLERRLKSGGWRVARGVVGWWGALRSVGFASTVAHKTECTLFLCLA
jgi:hypothetical protein